MATAQQAAALRQQLTNLTAQLEAVKEKCAGYDMLARGQAPWKANVEAMLLEQKQQQTT